MSQKEFNGRIIQKHDTSANWALAVNFIPKKGELILYTDLKKLKIGDGVTTVSNLPFTQADTSAIESAIYAAIDTKASQGDLNAHVGDSVKHITSAERTAWNSKANEADLQAHTSNSTIHVTSTDKSVWNAKQDAISDLNTIRSGAEAGATAVQPGDLADVATSGDYNDLINIPPHQIKKVNLNEFFAPGVALNLMRLGAGESTQIDGLTGKSDELHALIKEVIDKNQALVFYEEATSPIAYYVELAAPFLAREGDDSDGYYYAAGVVRNIFSDLMVHYEFSGGWSKPSLSIYQDVSEPTGYGTSGQVLTTDGAGVRSWQTVEGGKIDHIKVNNTEQTITDKTVNITVPTELNDLTDDSTHRLVTDTEKANWNAKYTKPSTGIPKTDLASSVQTSLGLADTALQSFTETDPTVPSWAKQTNKPTYTYTEVGADQSGAAASALSSAKSYTDTQIAALPSPMVFKGTLGTGGTITSLPTAAASNTGHTYKVITAGTYASQAAKVGDMFISTGSAWTYVPSGDEPSGTVTNIATGTGLTGGPISTSGTISLSSASIASLAKADSAIQPSSLATVATSGSYNDLSNKPTIDNNNQKIQGAGTGFGANDTVNIVAGSNVTVTPDTTNKKITIAATDTKYTAATAAPPAVAASGAQGSSTNYARQDHTHQLPTASASTLGGIKVGTNLSISNGVLSASGGSKTYVQSSEPTNAAVGDLWFDTDEEVIPSNVPDGYWDQSKVSGLSSSLSSLNSGKANTSTITTATLSSSSWSDSEAPYTYTLSVTGATASNVIEILPGLNITTEQLEALQGANIQDGGQTTNQITLKAFGEKPTINLPIRIIIRGDI